MSTHYMEEAQRLADRVVVISAGRILADSTPATLSAGGPALVRFRLAGQEVSFQTDAPQDLLLPVLRWADDNHRRLEGLTVTQHSLEDVYLQLTRTEDG